MKKAVIKLSKLFVILVILNSCSESIEDSSSSISLGSQVKIDKVLNIKIHKNQKIAYRLLNANEKSLLWSTKLTRVIENNEVGVLNLEQKMIIKRLLNKLNLNIFSDEDNNDEKEYFKNIYVPSFLEQAKPYFSSDQIGKIFYDLSYEYIDVKSNNLTAFGDDDCNCS